MPDIPDSPETTESIRIGETFLGTLETVADGDFIRIDVPAGQWVTLDAEPFGSIQNTHLVLSVRGERGNVVVSDSSYGGDPQVTFYTQEDTTYYVRVSGFANTSGAEYELSATAGSSPVLDTVLWGTQWADSNVSYYFADTEGFADSLGIESDGWNDYEREQFRLAFATIASVANITFSEVDNASDADMRLVLDDDQFDTVFPGRNILGFFNTPDFDGHNSGVFNANGVGWDDAAGGGLEEGGYGYVTIMHELLHGLGLAHLHDTGGSSSAWIDVTEPFGDFGWFDLNQGIFSTMSYNTGYWTGLNTYPEAGNYSFGFEAGPMALDIAALQAMYGANMNTALGDDVYDLVDENGSGTAWTTIWDAGGTDMLRHTGSDDAILDLRPASLQYQLGSGGFVSWINGIVGGYTIANGVIIENAMGGTGADLIFGNTVNNGLYGNAGNDWVFGGAGHDDIFGNTGNDTLFGGTGNDNIMGGVGNDTASGGSGDDTIDGGEGDDLSFGGSGEDVLTDDDGTNTLNGGSGDDTITVSGGAGSTLMGGTGADDLQGGTGNDILLGGRGADTLSGGDGADHLEGGMGADTLAGDAGADTFVFSFVSDSYAGDSLRDTITDFTSGEDMIDLSNIDADRMIAGDQSFNFIGSTSFSGAAAEVRFATVGNDVVIQVDRNGDGIGEMEIVLEDVSTLSASDFIL